MYTESSTSAPFFIGSGVEMNIPPWLKSAELLKVIPSDEWTSDFIFLLILLCFRFSSIRFPA
jgi:hypothetical protein